jgi:hypothetical protein
MKVIPTMSQAHELLFAVYLHHLFALAKAVQSGCNAVFAETPLPASGGYIKVSPELHAKIDGILIDAANLKKLIRTPTERGKSESKRTFEFRRLRSEALVNLLAGLSLPTLYDVQLRNSLEHFDEYLDELGANLKDGEAPPKAMAAYNLVLSHWEVTPRPVYPLRVYIAAERKYYNFDRQVDLGLLHDEAETILERLNASGVLRNTPEPGGLMVVFPS